MTRKTQKGARTTLYSKLHFCFDFSSEYAPTNLQPFFILPRPKIDPTDYEGMTKEDSLKLLLNLPLPKLSDEAFEKLTPKLTPGELLACKPKEEFIYVPLQEKLLEDGFPEEICLSECEGKIKEWIESSEKLDLGRFVLNDDDELLELCEMGKCAIELDFGEHIANGLSLEAIARICLNPKIKKITFTETEFGNTLEYLQKKIGLEYIKLSSHGSTFDEILTFIDNNASTLKSLILNLSYPEIYTYEGLSYILDKIKGIGCPYLLYVETIDFRVDDESITEPEKWCLSQGGSFVQKPNSDDFSVGYTFKTQAFEF